MIERLSPGGRWIALGTEEGMVSVQSTIMRDERWSIPEAHQGAVRVIAWSPDGAAVASGGEDALVKVWEAATGTVLALYTEHTGPISALDWSPDGCWMTSAEEAGGPYVWPIHDNTSGPKR